MADQDLDRNEDATPHKLEKAKEKGQVAKSADFVSAAVVTAAVLYSAWQGWDAAMLQFQFDRLLLLHIGPQQSGPEGLWKLVAHALRELLAWCAPLFATLVLVAIVANLVQTGPVLSLEPLKVDLERLHPVTGIKRIFSMRTLFEAARSLVKLVLLSGVAWFALTDLVPQFYALASMSTRGYLVTLLGDIAALGWKMAIALCLIAAVDVIYNKRAFAKKMRMSKRELKDEFKQREGDPRIRARMRELQREMRKRSQSVRRTGQADVVLTNPTHVAVALRYEHGKMEAPQVIAKGGGHLAAVMREMAARHRVPVVRSPALARRLYKELDIEAHVPPHMFAEVARIIVWVFAMRERHTAAQGTGARA